MLLVLGYLVVSFVLLEVYFKIAERFGIMDKPNERSSHKVVTLRGAGILFGVGSLMFVSISYFWLGLLIIIVISFYDDVRPLPPKVRMAIQFVAVALMVVQMGV